MEKNSYQQIVAWLKTTYSASGFSQGIVAVSGGIDSAVVLTLLTKALGANYVFPLLLPYADQETSDARQIVEFNQIPEENVKVFKIEPIVRSIATVVNLPLSSARAVDNSFSREEKLRLGNIMARVRMIILYDQAKKLKALVCGTENKSEKYLGYFTRFGDEASDIEPLQHLYKTEVRLLAKQLKLPERFLNKAPSAGLWQGQTDEVELGFSYEVADQVLEQLIDQKKTPEQIQLEQNQHLVNRVIKRFKAQKYKQQVPLLFEDINVLS